MNADVKDVVRECTVGSDEERLTFPQVVAKLNQIGVERYHADLQRAEKTYYLANGESCVVATKAVETPVARQFSAAAVESAVRAIQGQTIKYNEFCERIAAAGCVDYVVSLAGRRAIYNGRTGENYVEPFPPAR